MSRWRRFVPFGIAVPDKPRHYREMMRIAWDNKDSAGYAMRILRHGVCDGCSLGPRGLKDDVMKGTHLCLTRLNLLRMNTMGAMPDGAWEDAEKLRALGNEGLRALGRVPYPLLMEKGDKGFRRISWDEALDRAASWMRETPPARSGFFVTSRGITNETYYVAQKLARLYGTNNVDLCSRLCHAPTVVGLKSTIGYGAPTCSLSDLIGTDMLVLFGSDLANNQPVTTKYMAAAKKRGTRIVVVNPVREPGLERYWIPSKPMSAMFGTKLMDDLYQVNVGGDIAFITGVLKALDEIKGFDEAFLARATVGFDALLASVRAATWEELERGSGLARADMERFARDYAQAKSAVLLYSMGLTQHAHGVDNVRAIVNLALARGNLGREKCGIMPIRGHSGVQGGGECGVDPHRFPGGVEISAASAKRPEEVWGAPVPSGKGMFTGEMLEAIDQGKLDLLYMVGGNFRETMPDPRAMERSLARVKYRIHQDIVLNSSSVLEPGKAVLILPGQTRYEQRTGGTSTSTERRIRFTPEIKGPRIGEALPEWEIPALIGHRLLATRSAPERRGAFEAPGAPLGPEAPEGAPGAPGAFHFPSSRGDPFDYPDTATIRREIAHVMPMYAGIETLAKEGDWVQWGGPQLGAGGVFPNMQQGRARFSVVPLPRNEIPDGMFQVSTRRGKQFNSIVFRAKDPQMGNALRDDVLLSEKDLAALGLREGDEVVLSNDTGKMLGRVRAANVAPRHVVVYWPEANVLIPVRYDPEAGIPNYNAFVKVVRAER